MASTIRKKKARTRNRMGEMIAGNGRVWSSARRLVDRVRRWLVESGVPAVVVVPVSSRGQDTWFSATGPGFESPYRYTNSSITLFVDAGALVSGPGLRQRSVNVSQLEQRVPGKQDVTIEIHRASRLRAPNPTIRGSFPASWPGARSAVHV